MPQKRILIFGGTRRTGLEIARLLGQRGDAVVGIARETSDTAALEQTGARIVIGDAFDPEGLTIAVKNADCTAAICSLGNTAGAERKVDYEGVRNAIDAAVEAGLNRFILITAVGCGDSRPALSERAVQFLGKVCELKTMGEDHLKDSGLDWTIVRPGGLSSEPATGTAILTEDFLASGMIRRGDVARLTVQCLDNDATIGHAYTAIDPGT
jgi:uncharacterized protein YbjT (DUF2867 family)